MQPLLLAQRNVDSVAGTHSQRHPERESAAVKVADGLAESHAVAQRHADPHADADLQWVREPQCFGDPEPGHVADCDAERQPKCNDESGAELHRIDVTERNGLAERDAERQPGPNPEQLINALSEWDAESLQLLHDDRLPGSDRE